MLPPKAVRAHEAAGVHYASLGGAAAAWPLVRARTAGRRAAHRRADGFAESAGGQAFVAAFREELQSSGGRRAATSGSTRAGRRRRCGVRTTIGQGTRRAAPELILSQNTPTTAALLQQTRTIPIIFAAVSDPIGSGFVASLSHPGGNVTGFTNFEPTMGGKWLELLKEIAPRVNGSPSYSIRQRRPMPDIT